MKNVYKNEEDNSNDEINNYTTSIINFKLKTNLSILITILENKFKQKKLEFFSYLRIFSKSNQNNIINISSENINDKLKMYLVFHKIQKKCNNLVSLYDFFHKKKKSKFFSEWKNKISLEKSNIKIESELNDKYNKLYKSQISNIHTSIKKNEKTIEEIEPHSPRYEGDSYIDPETRFSDTPKNFYEPRIFVIDNKTLEAKEYLSENQIENFRRNMIRNKENVFYTEKKNRVIVLLLL